MDSVVPQKIVLTISLHSLYNHHRKTRHLNSQKHLLLIRFNLHCLNQHLREVPTQFFIPLSQVSPQAKKI
jgi:hypothetical protein